MVPDIVTRLRGWTDPWMSACRPSNTDLLDAADEIERLRAEVSRLHFAMARPEEKSGHNVDTGKTLD